MKHPPRLLLGIFALLAMTPNWASYAASAPVSSFAPLMNSLDRFHGDKTTWSFDGGVLSGTAGIEDTRTRRIFTVERFGNFVLRFQVRAGSSGGAVFARSAIHPIELLGGYEFKLGSQGSGLSFLDLPNFAKMAEARAKGVPYTNARALLAWDPPPRRHADEWVEYELACLGDHLTLKRDAATIVHYRHVGGPPEGSIGFRLDGPGRAEFRTLQIRFLGEVHWRTSPPAGNLQGQPADDWKGDDSPFGRISEEAWALETKQVLELARASREFRPLFEEGESTQWRESKSFWSVQDGVIRGESHNNLLVTTQDYSDFILKTQVRLTPKTGNSGIQIRSRLSETGMKGYQIDMAVHDTGKRLLRGGVRSTAEKSIVASCSESTIPSSGSTSSGMATGTTS